MSKMLKESKGQLHKVGLRLIGLSAKKFKHAVSTQEKEQVKHGQNQLDAFLQSPKYHEVSSSCPLSFAASKASDLAGEGLTIDNPVQLLSSQSDRDEKNSDDEGSDLIRHHRKIDGKSDEDLALVSKGVDGFSSSSVRLREGCAFDYGSGGEDEEEEDVYGIEDQVSDLHAMANSALAMAYCAKKQRLE